jgi:hypothetical protein
MKVGPSSRTMKKGDLSMVRLHCQRCKPTLKKHVWSGKSQLPRSQRLRLHGSTSSDSGRCVNRALKDLDRFMPKNLLAWPGPLPASGGVINVGIRGLSVRRANHVDSGEKATNQLQSCNSCIISCSLQLWNSSTSLPAAGKEGWGHSWVPPHILSLHNKVR